MKRGDLLAIGDNTGFSTDLHCHTQWRRIYWSGSTNYTDVDVNAANNSFDPTQFYDGLYAQDVTVASQLDAVKSAVEHINPQSTTALEHAQLAGEVVDDKEIEASSA